MNELAEALDRAAKHAHTIRTAPGIHAAVAEVEQTLLALIDAVTEIAAVLPAPHTVPKEWDLYR
jgi:hypothetical protein